MAQPHEANGPRWTMSKDAIAVHSQWYGRVRVVTAAGDIDMTTAPALSASLNESIEMNPVAVVVDLSRVSLFGSAGMTVLVSAQRRLTDPNRMRVVVSGPIVERPLRIVGLDRTVRIFPTLQSALGAVENQ